MYIHDGISLGSS